ncbi:Hypothetical predicted protein [Mytilus galloprovincialis]|uniref:Uncharacterized protein n=1 Tax=Mytilus galloprovincialis TaxID=29158 RepID=A0A8B6DYJ1_MYTGA|nr:Hypothetical predicted protein [Mytilus galloprovincialis]
MMTGSTVYSAIGQDSINAEQRHFDEVIREKPKEIPSDEKEMRMDHDIRNEINAIATLVSVVRPTLCSTKTFQLEGCLYIIDNQDDLTEDKQIQFISCSDNDDTGPLQVDDHKDTIYEMRTTLKMEMLSSRLICLRYIQCG